MKIALETLVSSVLGLTVTIIIYILFTRFVCCGGFSILGWLKSKFRSNKKTVESTEKKAPLLSNDQLISIFVIFHLLSHLILLALDITCLSKLHDDASRGIGALNESNSSKAANLTSRIHSTLFYLVLSGLPRASLYYEACSLCILPMFCGLSMVWSHFKHKSCSLQRYLRMVRFADVYMCFLCAPFSYSTMLQNGGVWYAVVALRLLCHATIFGAAVIAGMTATCFFCCILPSPEVDVPTRPLSEIEIRGYGQLFVALAFRMIPMAIAFYTVSSALNTYFTLSSTYTLNVAAEGAYIAFTLAKGAASLLRIGSSAVLLRWNLLTEDARKEDRAVKLMEFLDTTEVDVHIQFAVDMVTYGGLIALNSYVFAFYG